MHSKITCLFAIDAVDVVLLFLLYTTNTLIRTNTHIWKHTWNYAQCACMHLIIYDPAITIQHLLRKLKQQHFTHQINIEFSKCNCTCIRSMTAFRCIIKSFVSRTHCFCHLFFFSGGSNALGLILLTLNITHTHSYLVDTLVEFYGKFHALITLLHCLQMVKENKN